MGDAEEEGPRITRINAERRGKKEKGKEKKKEGIIITLICFI